MNNFRLVKLLREGYFWKNSEHIDFLEQIFESVAEGVVLCNSKGEIEFVNPRTELIFGYKADEILGKPVHLLVPEKVRKNHVKLHETYQNHPTPRSMGEDLELFGQKKDGSKVLLEISLNPIQYNGQKYVAAFIVDISSRKKLEEELREHTFNLEQLVSERTRELEHINLGLRTQMMEKKKAQAALEKSQKELENMLNKERELNALKSRFVSMASHEFRTPLSTILSSISLIDRYLDQNDVDKSRKHISKIQNSVSHLTSILEDFLSLGKLEEGKITPVMEELQLCDFSKEVMEDLRGLTKPGQNLVCSCQNELSIQTDKKMFRQILTNLISNAIKYSEEGNIELNISEEKSDILVAIKDEGMGIPKEDQKNMFSRFFRAANAVNIEGTGLGLNIVSKHLELLNGTISFESQEGIGTTFYIRLKK